MIPITTLARAPAKETLKYNVIFRRAQAEISQEELARQSGVSRAWISRIESGTADAGIDVIDRIAIALNTTVADLFRDIREDTEEADDDEIARRAAAPRSESVDARSLLDAVDEAAGRPSRRYSRRGRPPAVSRPV